MRWILYFILPLIMALGSCAQNNSPEGILPDKATQSSQKILEALLAQDYEAIKSLSDERLLEIKDIDTVFETFFDFLSKQEPLEPKLIFAEIRQNDTSDDEYPIYFSQYEMPIENDEYLLISLAINDQGSCCLLQHIKYKSYTVKISTYHDFTFAGKTLRYFVFFVLLIIVPLFISVTLVACVRNKNLKKKWLWFIFIMLGFYGLTLNWSTGEIGHKFIIASKTGSGADAICNLNLFSFQILGAGFLKSGAFTPWIITIGFPLGAIIYWWRQIGRSRREAKKIADKF